MPRLSATIEGKLERFETLQWLQQEHRRTFTDYRKQFCSYDEALTIEVPTILCPDCFGGEVDGILVNYRGPDVLPESWLADLANVLGDDDMAEGIASAHDSPRCHSCRRNLHEKALYVEMDELAERLGVSDYETDRIDPSKEMREEIRRFYGRRCFGCGLYHTKSGSIDHIDPRSNGGRANFQNLQPLCKRCGDAKGNRVPRKVVIVCDPWR